MYSSLPYCVGDAGLVVLALLLKLWSYALALAATWLVFLFVLMVVDAGIYNITALLYLLLLLLLLLKVHSILI